MLVALALFAFLLGSIPFGVLISRMKGVDIFSVGSGNIGATNVNRAIGPKWGMVVLLLDVAKGFIPGILTHTLIQNQPLGLDNQLWTFVIGCVAVLGHMYSPWIGFRGGKGIATVLGASLAAIPLTALLAAVVMIVVTATTRYVSLGSILAVIATIPISMFVSHDSRQLLPVSIVVGAFIIYKHRSNVQRLMNGTENKLEFKKNKQPNPPEVEEK